MSLLGGYANASTGYTQRLTDAEINQLIIDAEHYKNLDGLNKQQVVALKEQITALENLVQAHKETEAVLRDSNTVLRAANSERGEASSAEERRWMTVEVILKELKERLATVEVQRDRARSRLWKVGAFAFILGAGLAYAVKN